METTEEVTSLRRSSGKTYTLRLLFSGERCTVDRPAIHLSPGVFQIGRSVPDPGLTLSADKRVSRHHASLLIERDCLNVRDEQSRNGTFVNGVRVTSHLLVDGDVVRVGDSIFIVRNESEDLSDAEVDGLWGRAPSTRKLRCQLSLVAPTSATVLLLGDTGVGKEVAARGIHKASGRTGPFVAINCGAIPETLAESHLFGHVRGAFTGATPHPGMFRTAEKGTLLLDELGELPLSLQPKLLRVLEERLVLPVGATQPLPCDVRVIAATNRDLSESVGKGTFRADLFARLAEFTVHLPPLRDRREDILFLLTREMGSDAIPMSADLAEKLVLHSWPFNVRELVKLASEFRIRGSKLSRLELDLFQDRFELEPHGLGPEKTPNSSPDAAPVIPEKRTSGGTARAPIPNRNELLELLGRHHGSVADIARETGRSRAQVYRWLEQQSLNVDDYRADEKK